MFSRLYRALCGKVRHCVPVREPTSRHVRCKGAKDATTDRRHFVFPSNAPRDTHRANAGRLQASLGILLVQRQFLRNDAHLESQKRANVKDWYLEERPSVTSFPLPSVFKDSAALAEGPKSEPLTKDKCVQDITRSAKDMYQPSGDNSLSHLTDLNILCQAAFPKENSHLRIRNQAAFPIGQHLRRDTGFCDVTTRTASQISFCANPERGKHHVMCGRHCSSAQGGKPPDEHKSQTSAKKVRQFCIGLWSKIVSNHLDACPVVTLQ